MWLKIKQLGLCRVLVFGSICQGAILVRLFWTHSQLSELLQTSPELVPLVYVFALLGSPLFSTNQAHIYIYICHIYIYIYGSRSKLPVLKSSKGGSEGPARKENTASRKAGERNAKGLET